MERRWVFVLLDVLCVLVASLPSAILTLVNAPYKRGFYCGDDSIRYPYRPDTITHGLVAGVTISATVVLVSAGEAYLVYTERLYSRSAFNNYVAAVYKVVGAFLFGAAVSQSLTDLAKYMIGRLRPNFLTVCDPDWSRVNCSVYVQLEKVCRGNPADVTEARWLPWRYVSNYSRWGCLPEPIKRGTFWKKHRAMKATRTNRAHAARDLEMKKENALGSFMKQELGEKASRRCRVCHVPFQIVLLLRTLVLHHVLHGLPDALCAGAAQLAVGAAAAPHGAVLLGHLCPLRGLHPRVRPQTPLERRPHWAPAGGAGGRPHRPLHL
ncbi:phospholipid phosphatase 2 isoform X1 [Tamandua tetradactyla]|uniref:phospholipid phosphatase 2 isoform X1 n=1 Tax=Tamandua tetradactyla TaxID=48850 RepID=UPI0040545645